jgi:ribosomal protein S18 acetylase RimI-like enzyme
MSRESQTTDGLVIRPARDDDGTFVANFVPSLLEFGSPAWMDAQALAPGFRDVLAHAVSHQGPSAAVLIAETESGRRLGFVSLTVRQDVTGVERAHVADLAVAEDARRLGVGRALMHAAETWARHLGCSVLSLDVWATNVRARAFYDSLGYRPESSCLIKELSDPASSGDFEHP